MNSMMMHGRNNGKKLMTVTIVKHAFEIIHLLTGEVSQSKRKIFLCTCPSDKDYIKIWLSRTKEFLSKKLCLKLKTQRQLGIKCFQSHYYPCKLFFN